MNSIALVSVTYNSASTIEFFAKTASEYEHIFIVDNASTDDTRWRITEKLPNATLLPSEKNLGFGSANNFGFDVAVKLGIRWVLFSNPDCQIALDDAKILRAALIANSNAAVAFPRMADGNGLRRDVLTWDFTRPYKNISPIKVSDRDYFAADFINGACIDGSCFMVNAEFFERIGAFSSDLFLFCEEDDINLRAARSGFDVLCVPRASAIHLGGKSSSTTWRVVLLKNYSARWSKFFMINRYMGAGSRLLRVTSLLFVSPIPIFWSLIFFNKQRLAKWIGWLLASLDGLLMTKVFRKIF